MSIRRTLAVVHRVVRQLRGDRRTLALLFVLPPLFLGLGLVDAVFTNVPVCSVGWGRSCWGCSPSP